MNHENKQKGPSPTAGLPVVHRHSEHGAEKQSQSQ